MDDVREKSGAFGARSNDRSVVAVESSQPCTSATQIGVFPHADGSSYYEQGNTQCVASHPK